MCISIGHLSALCQEIVSPLSNWESDTLGNTQIRRPLWERMAFSRTNCPYPSDIPANGSANGSSPREKFLGTSENTRWKLRWVEEVGPQPESRAIANAKWLRDNFCLSSFDISLTSYQDWVPVAAGRYQPDIIVQCVDPEPNQITVQKLLNIV